MWFESNTLSLNSQVKLVKIEMRYFFLPSSSRGFSSLLTMRILWCITSNMPKNRGSRPFDPRNGGAPSRRPAPDTVFGKWLEECGMTVAEVADCLGITATHAYGLRRKRTPSLALALRIEELSEGVVPATSWEKK